MTIDVRIGDECVVDVNGRLVDLDRIRNLHLKKIFATRLNRKSLFAHKLHHTDEGNAMYPEQLDLSSDYTETSRHNETYIDTHWQTGTYSDTPGHTDEYY
jgi:hypothetical protein